jgi:hypothetical protein
MTAGRRPDCSCPDSRGSLIQTTSPGVMAPSPRLPMVECGTRRRC